MHRTDPIERGYALITSLIITAAATALAVGFIAQVNTEQKVSINDTQYSNAFYAAEAGLEKLNSDLSKLFQTTVFPNASQLATIQGSSYQPQLTGVSYPNYSLNGGQVTRLTAALTSGATTASVQSTAGWPSSGFLMIDAEEMTYTGITGTSFTGLTRGANGSTAAAHGNNAVVSRSRVITIAEGPNAGLSAQTIPFTLDVTARSGVGTEARLTREVQVALIPVFQFGVFSDSDLSFFAGPNFNFGGRVHSNGHLFLAQGSGATLTLAQKVTTPKEVVRKRLANGVDAEVSHPGTVNVVQTPGTYRALAFNEGSVVAGPTSSANSSWPSLSLSTYNGNILSRATGGKPLTLPFAGGGASPIEIIRRPPTGESPTSIVGQSRLYNQASLRILLSDSIANLPGGVGYPLTTVGLTALGYTVGAAPLRPPFATADPSDPDFVTATNGDLGPLDNANLIDGFIRIDRQNADGTWTDVTLEILNLGISTNQADAILRFQRPKPGASATSTTATDYWPINLFDAREGRFRDSAIAGLRKVGVMNIVEVDVNNLRRWFAGLIPSTTGDQALSNNGYILYFSDRRGNRNAVGNETGEFGFEDIINTGDAATGGSPNGNLDEGEDFNGDSALQTYGANLPVAPYTASTDLYATAFSPAATTLNEDFSDSGEATINVASTAAFSVPGYLKIGNEIVVCTGKTATQFTGCVRGQFGTASNAVANGQPVTSLVRAAKNRVHYFRRALRLVNGASPNLPTPGFTVASENPVYIMGNYNANGSFSGAHSYAAVIADSVTLLSSSWNDYRSFEFPYDLNRRPAATTWYRLAIAAGKGRNFPQPSGTADDFGTDGGTHNFLRYLEHWGGQTSHYLGSLVSLYYSHQGTGAYKCCTIVYSPPTRNYAFDTEFLVPSQLPPGTPRFRDINNLSFRQVIRSD